MEKEYSSTIVSDRISRDRYQAILSKLIGDGKALGATSGGKGVIYEDLCEYFCAVKR